MSLDSPIESKQIQALSLEQQNLFRKLTRLQKKIVIGVLAGHSNVEAYRRAGGSAKTPESAGATVSELLTNPNVKMFLDSVMEARVSTAIMSREEALQRLTSIARSNFTDVCCITEAGLEIKPDLTKQNASCIQEIIYTSQGVRIKLHSSLEAIKALSRLQGWEMPRQETVEVSEINKPETDALRLARKIIFVLNKAATQMDRNASKLISDSGHSKNSEE